MVEAKQQTVRKVRIIVDANIIFSAILNTNGKIGDLLINSGGLFEFIAPNFLRAEIKKHNNKIKKITGYSSKEIDEIEYLLYRDITFISEELISENNWKKAFLLVQDVDRNDITYIALSSQFNSKIWSGDKKLIKGLTEKGYIKCITTNELLEIREKLKKKKR